MPATDHVNIIPMTRSQLSIWLQSATPTQKRWVDATGFDASERSICLIGDGDGSLQSVLCGLGDAPTLWSLAHLPAELPPAKYQLEAESRQLALGFRLGNYRFSRYRNNDQAMPQLVLAEAMEQQVTLQAEAVALVRDLVNTPTEDMGPTHLSSCMEALAERGGARFREIVGDDLLAGGFPAIHAVGRAAAAGREPRLLMLDWGEDDHPQVVLVGKGVCFDTGGLDLKSAAGMRLMKKDMGGAAHVMALAQMIMDAQLPVRLRVLVPAVENAVAGNAYRPGDVIGTRAGLSVEIHNTDAEGRVVLCDALKLASEGDPDLIVDYATLTGAARVALGPDLPPLFCNDDRLAEAVLDAGVACEDPLWRMPLHQGYESYLDSTVADLSNCADNPMGGCITAALYLQRFVDRDIPWCHIDTYAWNRSDRPGRPAGGEAMGLRAMFHFLDGRYGCR